MKAAIIAQAKAAGSALLDLTYALTIGAAVGYGIAVGAVTTVKLMLL